MTSVTVERGQDRDALPPFRSRVSPEVDTRTWINSKRKTHFRRVFARNGSLTNITQRARLVSERHTPVPEKENIKMKTHKLIPIIVVLFIFGVATMTTIQNSPVAVD